MKLGGRLDISLAEYKKVKIRPAGSPWKQLALVSGKFVFELKKRIAFCMWRSFPRRFM